MDPKKQELNPELKEIYDRVMNTQVKNEAQPQSALSQPLPQAQQAPLQSQPANPDPFAPSTTPVKQPGSFANAQSGPTAVSFPSHGPLAPQERTAQFAPFVFTGNKVTTAQEPNTSQSQTHTNKKISGPIIAVLVVILLVAWALFWAKFFGLF